MKEGRREGRERWKGEDVWCGVVLSGEVLLRGAWRCVVWFLYVSCFQHHKFDTVFTFTILYFQHAQYTHTSQFIVIF